MWLALVAAAASAAEFAPAENPPDRRYKVEAYAWAPLPGKRYNLDWQNVSLRVWSALLECRRVEKMVDRCGFADDRIEFGYILEGATDAKVYELPADFELEVEYNKRGKAKPLAKGDREPLWQAVSQALLGRYHKPEGRYWKPDQWRQLGAEYEDELRYGVAGALEFQTPKDREGGKGWKANAPVIGQTWSGGAYGGTLDLTVLERDGSRVVVEGQGRIGDMNATDPNLSTQADAAFRGVWDLERGIPVETRTEIAYTRTVGGYFSRRLTVMRQARDTDTFHAGEIPGTPFRPE